MKESEVKEVAGQYWCDGEIPNCPDKKDCYKAGGNCKYTADVNYAREYPDLHGHKRQKGKLRKRIYLEDLRYTLRAIGEIIIVAIAAEVTVIIMTVFGLWLILKLALLFQMLPVN